MDVKKPDYPIIVLLVRDWNYYESEITIPFDFDVAEIWVSGFLLEEKKDSYVIIAQYIEKDNLVRHTQIIPKETVIWKQIIEKW